MRREHISVSTSVLLLAAFGAASARADLVDLTTYTITFTGAGLNPTAGSFTYDPDAPHFTAFSVTWDATVFDLTSSANTPTSFGLPFPACIGAKTGATASFALLSGACFPPMSNNTNQWFADSAGSAFEFFAATEMPLTNDIEIIGRAAAIAGPETTAGGQWTIRATSAVPEPQTIVLMPAMLLLLGLLARKRMPRGFHQAS
jgi:hypothetical protein